MTHHKLVIAEKPSVAQSIAAVLGAKQRRDGYLSGNGYLVSWCYGHLAELAGADVYDEKYAKWRYDDLPILPAGWRYTLRADKAKQFELLRDLMSREDVSEVINACDAGREGELIFRTVYYMAGCTKTMKDNAGAALLEAFKDAKGLEPVPIGTYRGFSMSLTVENFGKDFIPTLKGKMSHRVELGKDARGNLVRIDNALAQMPERYKTVQGRLENVQAQLATAKAELGKPFPQETELKEKSARLAELNAELNIDDRTPMEQAAENVVAKRPSVLGTLKAPCVHGAGDRKKSHEQEAR